MGRIVTFYSYKGGTGRSMALANVAWALASHNQRVLIVDWDLEAPGLHRYFHAFLVDRELTAPESTGLIDMVCSVRDRIATPTPAPADALAPYADVNRWAIPLRTPAGPPLVLGDRGEIRLLAAGRQDKEYGTRVNSFAWDRFYAEQNGGAFFDAVRASMRSYDFVLIDSRTGVSDTSGICTIQMPDTLVVCYTYNLQSIEGASRVARRVRSQRPDLPIFPVAMRAEYQQEPSLKAMREFSRRRFDEFLPDAVRVGYFDAIEVPYWSQYAYWERLAAFDDRPEGKESINREMARIATYLSDLPIGIVPAPDALKQQVSNEPPRPWSDTDGAKPAAGAVARWRPPVGVAGQIGAALAAVVAVVIGALLGQYPSPSAQRAQVLVDRVKNDLPITQLGIFLEPGLADTRDTRALYQQLYTKGIPVATLSAYNGAFTSTGRLVTCETRVQVWGVDGKQLLQPQVRHAHVVGCAVPPQDSEAFVLTTDDSARVGRDHFIERVAIDPSRRNLSAGPREWALPRDRALRIVPYDFWPGRGPQREIISISLEQNRVLVRVLSLDDDGQASVRAEQLLPDPFPIYSGAWDFVSGSAGFVTAWIETTAQEPRLRVWRAPYAQGVAPREVAPVGASIQTIDLPAESTALRLSRDGTMVLVMARNQLTLLDLESNRVLGTARSTDAAPIAAFGFDRTDRFIGLLTSTGTANYTLEVRAVNDLTRVIAPRITASGLDTDVGFGAGPGAAVIVLHDDSRVWMYRRDALPPDPTAPWKDLLAGVRSYTSVCLNADDRSRIFLEAKDVAVAAAKACAIANGGAPLAATNVSPQSPNSGTAPASQSPGGSPSAAPTSPNSPTTSTAPATVPPALPPPATSPNDRQSSPPTAGPEPSTTSPEKPRNLRNTR